MGINKKKLKTAVTTYRMETKHREIEEGMKKLSNDQHYQLLKLIYDDEKGKSACMQYKDGVRIKVQEIPQKLFQKIYEYIIRITR